MARARSSTSTSRSSGAQQLAAVLLILSGSAPAIGAQQIAITVRVGETAAFEVGYAKGAICDDTRIAYGEMRNKDAQTNELLVTGVAEGITLCRAGTISVDNRWTYLFEVTVLPEEAQQGSLDQRRRAGIVEL